VCLSELLEEAIGREYASKILPAIDDGMTLANRLEAVRAADINADLNRRVMPWRKVMSLLRNGNEASARAEVITLREGAVRAMRPKGAPHDQGWLAGT
jgi:hypothetical protein